MVPFISSTKTSNEAWDRLVKFYANHSHLIRIQLMDDEHALLTYGTHQTCFKGSPHNQESMFLEISKRIMVEVMGQIRDMISNEISENFQLKDCLNNASLWWDFL